jgi:NADH-quinone oxidoreductase subunit H
MIVDPTRTVPIIKFIIHTDFFRAAVFPGFAFAAMIAATTIFVERKFLAKMQLRTGPLYQGKLKEFYN